MMFPIARGRRLRGSPRLRRMVRETRLRPEEFIEPLFAVAAKRSGIEVEP